MAGDLKITGKRDNILVIREENGMKIKYTINLLSNESFVSPVFYLQQNDVVIVEPNYASIQVAASNASINFFLGLMGIVAIITQFF